MRTEVAPSAVTVRETSCAYTLGAKRASKDKERSRFAKGFTNDLGLERASQLRRRGLKIFELQAPKDPILVYIFINSPGIAFINITSTADVNLKVEVTFLADFIDNQRVLAQPNINITAFIYNNNSTISSRKPADIFNISVEIPETPPLI